MTPYRSRLLGLPLQRSLFATVGDGAALLGFGEGSGLAHLGADGSLHVDRLAVQDLLERLPTRLTHRIVHRLHTAHGAAWDGLAASTARAALLSEDASRGVGLDAVGALDALESLGTQIASIVPYGVLAKFVPDALANHLLVSGDLRPAPFPLPSAAATLAADVAALADTCEARGWSPARLAQSWPDVPPRAGEPIETFCAGHIGHGPLAWEMPGFEDPGYLLSVLLAVGTDRDGRGRRMEATRRAFGGTPIGDPLGSVRAWLALWLSFLDVETLLVRAAFLRGLAPLLGVLGGQRGVSMPALLQMTFDEALAACTPASGRSPTRRHRRSLVQAAASRPPAGVTLEAGS